MRAFVILSSVLVLSTVYADVSHLAHQQYNTQYAQQAYQYPQPRTAYQQQPQYPATSSDVATSSYNGIVNSYVPPASGAVGPYNRAPGAYSQERAQSYLIPPAEAQPAQSHASHYQQQYAQTNLNQRASGSAATYAGQTGTYASGQATSAYSGVQANQYSQQRPQQLAPIVTKHFYVHAAPEDPEENEGPRYVHVGQPRKNYKVIFIKAPTYGSSSQIIPILPQNEDKTIVYVLSKKPTFNQNIQLPEPPVTEPSKPDVFFIKYKTAEEAQQAQEKIQAAYEAGNLGASDAQPSPSLNGQIQNVVASIYNGASSALSNAQTLGQNAISQVQGVGTSIGSNLNQIVNQNTGNLFGRPSSDAAQGTGLYQQPAGSH